MMKTRLCAMLLASMVLLYTSCSEKEVPQPVEDTERVDQLRNELRALQEKIYGKELSTELLTADKEDLEKLQTELQAEITKLQELYSKAVPYTVMVLDNLGTPISGASVTLNQNGTLVTKTTDSKGTVQIENVRAGVIGGVIKATGHTTVNYYATLAFSQDAGVSTRIIMIPKTGTANTYTVKGFLYANTNLANDTAGGFHANGTAFIGWKGRDAATKNKGAQNDHKTFEKVNKKITARLWVNINYVPFSTSAGNGGNSADLIQLAYEDASVTAVFDANNQFTMNFPVTSIYQDAYGNDAAYWWEISFEEFVADQTLVDYDPNGILDGGAPHTAWPMPKTYTSKRVFRGGDWEGSDDSNVNAGEVINRNFFYYPSTY